MAERQDNVPTPYLMPFLVKRKRQPEALQIVLDNAHHDNGDDADH
ncbi:Uncharacterised protein [Yersinia enterocolitica]|nr:Uncharacterised protein [Yersinia enterocolitica]